MSSGLSDQAARDRITGELDSNLGVEAGAGTGKTTVPVERVTNVLASGKATVDELVVITFTEKAAAELSTRVRDALDQRALSSDGAGRERVEAAARDLYRCHIETIHSFAASLLRERPVEAGIDPLFEVVDGLAGSLSFDAAYETFQDELLSTRSPELERALRRGLGLDELREACELVNQYRYLRPLQLPKHDDGELAAHLTEFRRIGDELRALLARCNPGEDSAVEIVEGIIEWTERLEALETEAEQEFQLLYRPRAYTSLNAGSKANWGDGKEHLKVLQQEYRDAHTAAQDGLRTDALLSPLPRIERFVDDYEHQRRKGGEPDFDDLLFWAAELLRTTRPARDYFRRRYKLVVIDEFQDTDPVQAELALLLTSEQDPDGDWRELRPAPGRLTVVGDPKQSIYRFRRADINVYDRSAVRPCKTRTSRSRRTSARTRSCSPRSTPCSTRSFNRRSACSSPTSGLRHRLRGRLPSDRQSSSSSATWTLRALPLICAARRRARSPLPARHGRPGDSRLGRDARPAVPAAAPDSARHVDRGPVAANAHDGARVTAI